jgi:hypothetical protein
MIARGRAQWKPRRKCSGAGGSDPSIILRRHLYGTFLYHKDYLLNHLLGLRWIAHQASYQYNTSPLLGSFPSRACTAQFRRAPPHWRTGMDFSLFFGFGFVPNFVRGFSSSTRAVSSHPNIDVGKEGEPSQLLLHHIAHPQVQVRQIRQLCLIALVHTATV